MGGTVDPETGDIVWEFSVPLAEQCVHYTNHPPSALAEWSPASIPVPGHSFDGHGEPVNTAFAIRCLCGGAAFTADAFFEDNEDDPDGPAVRFEFPSDVLGDPEFAGQEHDLFSWISVVGRNRNSGTLTTLLECECA